MSLLLEIFAALPIVLAISYMNIRQTQFYYNLLQISKTIFTKQKDYKKITETSNDINNDINEIIVKKFKETISKNLLE
jgi:hypothetical protein